MVFESLYSKTLLPLLLTVSQVCADHAFRLWSNQLIKFEPKVFFKATTGSINKVTWRYQLCATHVSATQWSAFDPAVRMALARGAVILQRAFKRRTKMRTANFAGGRGYLAWERLFIIFFLSIDEEILSHLTVYVNYIIRLGKSCSAFKIQMGDCPRDGFF